MYPTFHLEMKHFQLFQIQNSCYCRFVNLDSAIYNENHKSQSKGTFIMNLCQISNTLKKYKTIKCLRVLLSHKLHKTTGLSHPVRNGTTGCNVRI